MKKGRELKHSVKLQIVKRAKEEGRIVGAYRFHNGDGDYYIEVNFFRKDGKLSSFRFSKEFNEKLKKIGIEIKG